ncbi:MAG: twin transmembrane helix small protein [Gammaproteobacteria bacterium]|nr:twin transmembrane helix small protein [Gammaproteobacteria bacterium]
MLFKAIIIILLLLIIFSLGQALYHMMRKENNPDGVVNSLTVRISLSVLLFFLILFGTYMGWITPHAIT